MSLPGLPGLNLNIGLPGGLNIPTPIPGLNIQIPLPVFGPGPAAPKVAGDQNQVTTPTGGAAAPGKADIDNVNLDNAELRALDNLMQTYLADGKFTPEEQKVYQEVRCLFARSAEAPAGGGGTQPTTPTAPVNPTGGGTQVPPVTPAPTDLWPTGKEKANGLTFKSWGDPHEVTGDGGKFDNMKTGTFTKLKSASGDFELQTTQAPDKSGRWPGATLNHKAAVKDGKDVVAYDGLAKTMTINGKATPMPKNGESINLPGGGKVVGTADGVQIQTSKGDKVNIHQKDSYIDISGEMSANRKDGEIRGSLGAMDADKSAANDAIGRDGKQYNTGDKASLDAFLEDWRTKPGESLFPADPAGGGGEVDPTKADFEAEFAKRDVTGNGFLTGPEIPADYKAANPTDTAVSKEEFLKFREGQETKAKDAVVDAFKAADFNPDQALDGKEIDKLVEELGKRGIKVTAEQIKAMDKGGNNAGGIEIQMHELIAGLSNQRRDARWADLGGAPPLNPAGGGGPAPTQTQTPAPTTAGEANPTGGTVPNGPTIVTMPKLDDDDKKPRPRDQRNTNRDLRAFNRADRNNDGVLTGENTLKRFGKFDKDGDGKVTAAEFLEGRAKQRAENEFKRADRNKDGALSGPQTLAKFKAYDANNDGKVTREEYLQGRLAQTEQARKAAEARNNTDDRK